MALRLKKIEISSAMGSFCDKDLANIPAACKNLQWADFQFPFTFPKTTTPSPTIAPISSFSVSQKPRRLAIPQLPLPNFPSSLSPSILNPSSSLLQTNPTSSSTSRLHHHRPLSQFLPRIPIPHPPLSPLPSSPCSRRHRRSRTHRPRPSKTLIAPIHPYGILGWRAGRHREGCLAVCEGAWRSLKRLHVRGCRGVKVGCVMENFVVKGLEVDLVVDGGRGVGGSNRFSED
ncbi:hypothetical protein BC829DRAFT_69042 [Chytridium lagenaria]|nr:hypothetical protein BC829DRAFT_69042 [Chytridium lagenaria]